jgi:hypothetical protein
MLLGFVVPFLLFAVVQACKYRVAIPCACDEGADVRLFKRSISPCLQQLFSPYYLFSNRLTILLEFQRYAVTNQPLFTAIHVYILFTAIHVYIMSHHQLLFNLHTGGPCKPPERA